MTRGGRRAEIWKGVRSLVSVLVVIGLELLCPVRVTSVELGRTEFGVVVAARGRREGE